MKSSTISVLLLFALVVSSIPVIKANERPRNTLTKYGQPTILSCCSSQANAGLYWRFRKWDASDAEKVCDKDTWREGYSRFTNDTCLNLIIVSTTPQFAGLYQCVEPGGITTGGHVSVYDNFTCDVNMSENQDLVEGDHVLVNCSIYYVGNPSIELLWPTAEPVHKTTFPKQPQDHIYNSTLKVVAKRPALQPHIAAILRDKNASDENIDKRALNISSASPSYPVMYPVSNIRTSCAHENDCEKKIGDSINCSADGHPTPKFRWLNWDGKLVFEGAVLMVDFLDSQKFTCVAMNSIRGKENELSIQVVVIVVKDSAGIKSEIIHEKVTYNYNFYSWIMGIIVLPVVIYISYKQIKKCKSTDTKDSKKDGTRVSLIDAADTDHDDELTQKGKRKEEAVKCKKPIEVVDEGSCSYKDESIAFQQTDD